MGCFLFVLDGTPGFQVDPKRRVDESERRCRKHLARGRIDDVDKTISLRSHYYFSRRSIYRKPEQNALVDGVVVEQVVRAELIEPASGTGVRITREHPRRPLVVAGTLFRIPGSRVSGAVVDEVELRI